MKKLFGLLTALILAVVMIFPMGVFADAGGNTSNATEFLLLQRYITGMWIGNQTICRMNFTL